MNEAEDKNGIVFNIQSYSIHDGPGIRSNVFLKGCPLRCVWCQNPESQASRPEFFLMLKCALDAENVSSLAQGVRPGWATLGSNT